MAYADFENRSQISPFGLGGALFLTGGLVTAIIFAAPHIVPELKHYESLPSIVPTAPPVQPVVEKKKQEETVPPDLSAPPSPTPQLAGDSLIIPPLDLTKVKPILPPDPEPKALIIDKTPPPIETTLPPPPVPDHVRLVARLDPRFQSALQPPYPSAKRREGVGGRVTVRVLIGADGHVKAVESVRVDDPAFFEATRDQALKKWRFLPETLDGKPVESWKTLSVVFKMDGE